MKISLLVLSGVVILLFPSLTKFSTEAWLLVRRRVHHSRKDMMFMEVGAGCVLTDQEAEREKEKGRGYTPPKTQARYHLQGLSDLLMVSRAGVLKLPPPP